MISTIFGTILGAIFVVVLCVVGIIAILAAIIKGFKQGLTGRNKYAENNGFPKGVKRWRA